jgi:hypothetical protein
VSPAMGRLGIEALGKENSRVFGMRMWMWMWMCGWLTCRRPYFRDDDLDSLDSSIASLQTLDAGLWIFHYASGKL